MTDESVFIICTIKYLKQVDFLTAPLYASPAPNSQEESFKIGDAENSAIKCNIYIEK